MTNPQLREPNFKASNGKIFLVRCYKCDNVHGKENWMPAVASGVCAWCGDDANLFDDVLNIFNGF